MADSIFDDDVELFRNVTVLEEDYTPEQIVCRDHIMKHYIDILKPIYKGRPPQNAFLYGDTGVGKTAVTKHLIDRLETDIDTKNEQADHNKSISLRIIRINCQNLTTGGEQTTSYQVAVALVNELRSTENKIASTGYAPQAVYSMLYDEIEAIGGTVLIILDEIDRIRTDDTILYDLPRARDNDRITNARIGVIGISNDYTFRSNLSPKVRDTLCETEIKFPAYDATQLERILHLRAVNAFRDTRLRSDTESAPDDDSFDYTFESDILTDDVIPLASAFAMRSSSGSARRAIRLLRRAGEIAERNGETLVVEDHVREARDDLESGDVVEAITHQDTQKLYILAAVANLTEQSTPPFRVKTIYSAYESIFGYFGGDPLSQRGMYNHLTKLVMLGFLTQRDQNTGRAGGQYYTFELKDEISTTNVQEAFEMRDLSWPSLRLSN